MVNMLRVFLMMVTALAVVGCKSTSSSNSPDIVQTKQTDLIEYTVRIDSSVSMDEFQNAIYKKLVHKSSDPYSLKTSVYSSVYDTVNGDVLGNKNTTTYFMLEGEPNEFLSRSWYLVQFFSTSFTKTDEFNEFKITFSPHEGKRVLKGFARLSDVGKVTDISKIKLDFSRLELELDEKFNSLSDFGLAVKTFKEYSGTKALKNDDVTAYANIQREHSYSHFSTNKKTDSEKSGTFLASNEAIPFNFSLYPYKGKSKLKYNFKVPFYRTYFAYSYGQAPKKYEDELDLSIEKKVISSATASFNQ